MGKSGSKGRADAAAFASMVIHSDYVDADDIRFSIRSPTVRMWFNLYEQIFRTKGSKPALKDFDPSVLSRHNGSLILVRKVGEGDFYYLWYGVEIEAFSGFNMIGKCTSEMNSGVFRYFEHTYQRALDNGSAILAVHSAPLSRQVASWERLIMPLASPDNAEELLIVNVPRQSRENLALSIQRALAWPVIGVVPFASNRSPEDGRLVYVNSAASSLLGTDENFIEDWLSEAVPGFLESDVWRRILEENRSGECQTFALRAAIPDDQHKWCVHVSRNDDLWILMFIDENECRLMHAD